MRPRNHPLHLLATFHITLSGWVHKFKASREPCKYCAVKLTRAWAPHTHGGGSHQSDLSTKQVVKHPLSSNITSICWLWERKARPKIGFCWKCYFQICDSCIMPWVLHNGTRIFETWILQPLCDAYGHTPLRNPFDSGHIDKLMYWCLETWVEDSNQKVSASYAHW